MPSFAGALLPYERSPMPDDNDVQTRLPSRCVDYLSHNWDESDVWTSWKAMTRHKNEMANGVRLENASWRTWAKQRSNLKTISPETLNWLKDSDVTWLYGPLHTAVDPVPPARISSTQDRFNLDGQPQSTDSHPPSTVHSRPGSSASTRSSKTPGKPILKHRSLSEILGVGLSRTGESASEDGSEDGKIRPDQAQRARVSIAHASSDSTLVKLGNASATRGSSPTIINGYESSDVNTSGDDSDVARRASAMRGHSGSDDVKPKKHISFSHRVEQCIAVDSEEERTSYVNKNQLCPTTRAGPAVIGSNVLDDDDDDDDEDDLLTFRSSAPRQAGLHAVSQRYTLSSTGATLIEPYGPSAGTSILLPSSSASEPFTIARMAPTTLKSSEVLPAPSPVVVYDRDLPSGLNSHSSSYARPTYTVTATPSAQIGMDYTTQTPIPQASSNATPVYSHQTSSSYSSRTYGPVAVSKVLSPPVTSPSADHLTAAPIPYGTSSSMNHWSVSTPDDEDTEEFTAMGFDYFSGPDLGLGDEYDMSRLPSQHLASFQPGFNSSDVNAKPGSNEDSTLLRSILKTHVISPSAGSPVGSPGKFAGQDAILVPQVKSNHKTNAAHSSSSSSLSSSPFSPRNDSSSSLATLPNENAVHNTETFTLPTLSDCPQNDPDRHSRGRSSSRGSSASGFERSSIDKRPSSYSPTHSPPLHSAGTSTISVTSNYINSVGGSSRSSTRPGGPFVRAHSYDVGRPLNSKSSLVHAPIGEEDESDDSRFPTNTPTALAKSLNNISLQSSEPSITSLPANCTHGTPPQLSSHEGTRSFKSIALSPRQSPCHITEPKLATAQLNGSVVVPNSESSDSPGSNALGRPCNSSNATHESIASGSPTLYSLLSKQGNSASWWSDERLGNSQVARSSSERKLTRPSLQSSNSDSSTSTFIGRTSFSQSDRKFLGASRAGGSVDEIRCSSGDEFGFGNYYGGPSPEDEDLHRDESDNSGVISRAADIVETAKVIVGALWNVGSRSIWGAADSENSPTEFGNGADGKSRAQLRRASTGGFDNRSDDGQSTSFQQHSTILDKQPSHDHQT